MNNRNVKVIDENNIDRDGKVICGFTLNNIDYVLYYIGRDEDNDNLFDSKVIKNFDGTSSMVNIDNDDEKDFVDDIVRKLVKYAVDNDQDTLDGTSVTIDGKDIAIFNVKFNKEQNITVSKTYVATVKRSVSLVAYNFYKVEEQAKKEETPKEEDSIFVDLNLDEKKESEEEITELPSLDIPEDSLKVEEPVLEVKNDKEEVLEVPASLIQEEPKVEAPKVEAPKVEAVVAAPAVKDEPIVATPAVKDEPIVATPAAPVTPEPVKVEAVKTEPTPVTPVVAPEAPAPAVAPVAPTPAASTPSDKPVLFFDASKEANLNSALGEASTDKVVTADVQDVQILRDFGTSDVVPTAEPVATPQVTPTAAPVVTPPVAASQTGAQPSTTKGGFANNKFFTVIAIMLFLGACVFLGYEAFQYFTLTK